MYGNGDGTFQSPVNEGGGAAGNIVIADINSDGRNDVVSLGVLLAQPEGATTSATTLISSQNPAATADNITLTATVSPPEATGSVTFYDGSVVLGALTLSGGTASLTLNPLAAGSHSLKAVYSGGAGFSSSTSVLTETIVPEFTPGPILSNTLAVNLLVNGGAEDGLSGWYPSSPESTVVAETAPGGGTYSFEGKQAPSAFITQTLPIGLLGEAVDSQLNSGKFVANYSFWFADASPGSGSYGSITLTFLDRNGNLIGQGVSNPLQNTGTTTWINGTGSFPVPPGTEVVNYTMNFLTTSSVNSGLIDGNSLTIVGPTATTLTSSQNPAQPGDTISLTAGVSTGLQNDMVSFFDGSTLLGSASIGGDGAARLSVSNLALGNHSLRAVYAGNRADDSSTSNVLTEVILTEMPPGATVPNPLTSNLLVNPGAEQGTTGWYPASAGSIVDSVPPAAFGRFFQLLECESGGPIYNADRQFDEALRIHICSGGLGKTGRELFVLVLELFSALGRTRGSHADVSRCQWSSAGSGNIRGAVQSEVGVGERNGFVPHPARDANHQLHDGFSWRPAGSDDRLYGR